MLGPSRLRQDDDAADDRRLRAARRAAASCSRARTSPGSRRAKRNVNMVFQAYALFPHMTVAENVAFGLEIKRVPRAERDRRVAEMLRIVRLDGLRAAPARRSSPAASSSASRSPARWSTGPPRCCSTSRSARST